MKNTPLHSLIALCAAALPASAMLAAQAAPAANTAAAAPAKLVLPIVLYSGATYPSMRPEAMVEVDLNGGGKLTGAALVDEVIAAEAAKWDCKSASSYQVVNQTTKKVVAVANVLPVGRESCDDRPIPAPVLLVLRGHFDTATSYVVTLTGLPGGATATSAASKFPAATAATAVSILPQAVPGESLTNGTTRDVGQLTFSYGFPYVGDSPVFINTKNLFSTNERDSKSAFSVTSGVQFGLLRRWYLPVQLSETVQGNQVATSASAVSNLSISGLFPWYWSRTALNNSFIEAPQAPEFAVAGQYTHRIAQLVTAKTPMLAVNDAAINPALTIEPFYLFQGACNKYRKWLKLAAPSTTTKQFCLGYQLDLGTWYLPLDKTKAGSQQVEGYGDASILIPLSNLNFPKVPLVSADSLLNSQIHVEYSDSVNAANNYARSRQWSVGIEVMK